MKTSFRFQVLIICLIFARMLAIAQSSQMATLLHDGTITNFYTSTAFSDALEAAIDGDIISLSSGSFTATDITKNITIRGAGYTVQGYNENENPTILTGDLNIQNSKSDDFQLTIEGIQNNSMVRFYGEGVITALKCQFKQLYLANKGSLDIKFIHCIIDGIADNGSNPITMSMLNSIVKSKLDLGSSTNAQYDNCIVTTYGGLSNSIINNSIFTMTKIPSAYGGPDLGQSCHVVNSIIIGCATSKATGSGNKHLSTGTNVFSNGSFYNLSNEYSDMIGTDGTEIGIHGGNMPFTPISSRPRVTKFNVASKTTIDGKLSIDIEVKGEE